MARAYCHSGEWYAVADTENQRAGNCSCVFKMVTKSNLVSTSLSKFKYLSHEMNKRRSLLILHALNLNYNEVKVNLFMCLSKYHAVKT